MKIQALAIRISKIYLCLKVIVLTSDIYSTHSFKLNILPQAAVVCAVIALNAYLGIKTYTYLLHNGPNIIVEMPRNKLHIFGNGRGEAPNSDRTFVWGIKDLTTALPRLGHTTSFSQQLTVMTQA